jgi:hypothetical protein
MLSVEYQEFLKQHIEFWVGEFSISQTLPRWTAFRIIRKECWIYRCSSLTVSSAQFTALTIIIPYSSSHNIWCIWVLFRHSGVCDHLIVRATACTPLYLWFSRIRRIGSALLLIFCLDSFRQCWSVWVFCSIIVWNRWQYST